MLLNYEDMVVERKEERHYVSNDGFVLLRRVLVWPKRPDAGGTGLVVQRRHRAASKLDVTKGQCLYLRNSFSLAPDLHHAPLSHGNVSSSSYVVYNKLYGPYNDGCQC